ncbi:hypothetical protein PISMIDRAFT_120164 [Pisolithus microcarpus 441]|uniref:Uncharacterized protein n=1 Tax=Pisolithus microcarpus 441 TaxID=765257 RepID=A0A0C9YY10_9AGAM|nr:hypothetical protein BKA83DRAFT_120164 [Pisolithus microcarpus]KIK12823.1 hypothetical protein PISMIDRAFT_120164 [Pisolithus microcarpus 441]
MHSHLRYPSNLKCPLSPLHSAHNSDFTDHKGQCSFRNPPSGPSSSFNRPFPACAVCLGRHHHLVIDCRATRMWDNKHDTFTERIHKALFTKDSLCICAGWQREEGCSNHHDVKHICSGCGLSSHGAQKCSHTQTASSNYPI